jgi:hypothetical protein
VSDIPVISDCDLTAIREDHPMIREDTTSHRAQKLKVHTSLTDGVGDGGGNEQGKVQVSFCFNLELVVNEVHRGKRDTGFQEFRIPNLRSTRHDNFLAVLEVASESKMTTAIDVIPPNTYKPSVEATKIPALGVNRNYLFFEVF